MAYVKKKYRDGAIGLVGVVLSSCMNDFRKAVRAWKKNPCEDTKRQVNMAHEKVIRNVFAPYVPFDLEEACQVAYEEEMGG